ncbi:pathogenicity island protein [Staphylococcus aureus]|nr:pathogenicity island protein [Staphylococcus aureus]
MEWTLQQIENNFEFEVVKEKINDVAIKHGWFVEDKFVKNELETKQEHINFSASYLEHRIQNEHTVELLQVYLKEFGELIQKFHEIEKASLQADQSESNA